MDFYDEKMKLNFPGKHNKLDGAVALAVAHILEIDKHKAEKSLSEFSGTWRRFEFKGETKDGTKIYDDYGHHPTEIKATLKGAREMFKKEKIIVVFQPHLFSRTKLLLNDFAKAFTDADEVLLVPIFPAREVFDPTISSDILASAVIASEAKQSRKKKVHSFSTFSEAENYLKKNLKGGEVLITMGAGEAYKIGEKIV
jgi:UDP-N-acetylmuramate--alanine ligase